MEGFTKNLISAMSSVGTGRSIFLSRLAAQKRANKHRDKRFVYHTGNSTDIIDWCIENFGNTKRNRWGYSKSYGTIYITDNELAVAFKLRWS